MGRIGALVLLTVVLGAVCRAKAEESRDRLSAEELLAAIESGHAPLIVDVRTQGEYDAGHVPGAVHIPFYNVLAHRAEIAASSEPVVIYCEHGPRAGIAKLQLWAAGVDRIMYLDGHMSGWKGRGLPVERAGQ